MVEDVQEVAAKVDAHYVPTLFHAVVYAYDVYYTDNVTSSW